MSVSAFLFPILAADAELMATGLAGEFAKSTGKAAFEKLKNVLRKDHGVDSIDLIDQVAEKPAYGDAIKSDLDQIDLTNASELHELANTLLNAIEALPCDTRPAVAIDVDEIRAAGDQVFRNVEGIRANKIISDGAQTFEGITRGKG